MKALLLAVVFTALASWSAVNAADNASKTPAGRWQIHVVANGMSVRDGKPGSRTESTILLDSETGKTWLFWPTKDTATGYSWIEITQREEPAKQ